MSGDPTFAYMQERLQAVSDEQEMTVYCSRCPEWSFKAAAQEARAEAERHRVDEHPDIVVKKRIVRKRRSFSSAMTAEREEQIEEERRQRMRALGIP